MKDGLTRAAAPRDNVQKLRDWFEYLGGQSKSTKRFRRGGGRSCECVQSTHWRLAEDIVSGV